MVTTIISVIKGLVKAKDFLSRRGNSKFKIKTYKRGHLAFDRTNTYMGSIHSENAYDTVTVVADPQFDDIVAKIQLQYKDMKNIEQDGLLHTIKMYCINNMSEEDYTSSVAQILTISNPKEFNLDATNKQRYHLTLKLGVFSASAPAMATFGERLYMAGYDVDNAIFWATLESITSKWTEFHAASNGWWSHSTPALAASQSRLYMLHRTREDGIMWSGMDSGERNWGPVRLIPGCSTPSEPAVAVLTPSKSNDQIYVAYRGQNNLIYWGVLNPEANQWEQYETDLKTKVAPAIATLGENVYMAYVDPGSGRWAQPKIHCTVLNKDKRRWEPLNGPNTRTIPSNAAVALIGFSNKLHLMHCYTLFDHDMGTYAWGIRHAAFDPNESRNKDAPPAISLDVYTLKEPPALAVVEGTLHCAARSIYDGQVYLFSYSAERGAWSNGTLVRP